MIKKVLMLIFLPLLLWFTPLDAQDEENAIDQAPEITDVEGLRAEFKQYTQDPESKEAKFEMILKSNLDSDRVRISWTLTTLDGKGAIFKDKAQTIRHITIAKGQTYTIPITIIPTGKGEVELLGKAESFKAGEAFTVTVKKVFATNSLQEVLPLTSEYRSSKLGVLAKNILIFLLLFAAGVFAFIKGVKWFKKWLNR